MIPKNLSLAEARKRLLAAGLDRELVEDVIAEERSIREMEKMEKARKMTEACLREMGL